MKSFMLVLFFAAITVFPALSQTSVPATQSNYYGRMSVGVLAGKNVYTSMQISNGYRFRHIEVGFGLGLERFGFERYVPLFLESRYNFGKGNTQPFVGIKAGYLAALNRYEPNSLVNQGGYLAGINVGLTHYFTPHFGMTSQIGYRRMQSNQYGYYLWQNLPNQVEFRIGIVLR